MHVERQVGTEKLGEKLQLLYVSWKYSKTIHMNLFFYLQTFILNYSFIVILGDHIFCTLFD
jgi:hypothetical protein